VRSLAALAALWFATALPGTGCGAEDGDAPAGGAVALEAWALGPEPSSYTRKTNLVEGARRLNLDLAAAGDARRVALAADYASTKADAFVKKLIFAFASDNAPDIVCGGHELVGQLAAADYLAPLDELLAARPRFRDDFFPVLWSAMRHRGRTYGVPQDNEVRVSYIRRDLLRRAGWSDDDVARLPDRVVAGEVTLEDLAAVAEKAVAAGAVERGAGIWHRNRSGFDWFQFLLAYGGRLEDPDSGRLVLPRAATLATLRLFDRLVDGGATPPGMMSYPDRTIYNGFVRGRALVYLTGGSWHKLEWETGFGFAAADFAAQVASFPVPAGTRGGRPVSVSHPFACMVSARAADVELAFRVVERSLDPDLDIGHALGSSHLVVRQSSSRSEAYRADPFLQQMIGFLRFTHFAPNHTKLTRLQRILYDGIRGVEVGALDPDEALDFIERVARARLGADVVVE
jgi:inositol-phosphate transport system substrate-binding protein